MKHLTITLITLLMSMGAWAEDKEEWGYIINAKEAMILTTDKLKSCGAINAYEVINEKLSNDLKFVIAEFNQLSDAESIITCYLEPFNLGSLGDEFKFTIGKGL